MKKSLTCLLAVVCAYSVMSGLSVRAQTLAEALDNDLVWVTGGNSGWFVQTTNTHDGIDAVRSGAIGSNEISWLETTVEGPATITYWSKQASLDLRWRSTFTINGAPTGEPATSDWSFHTVDLGAGINVLRWSVSDPQGSGSTGLTLLDQFVAGPPRPLEITYPPYDQQVYTGDSFSLFVAAVGTPPLNYQWRKDGADLVDSTNSWISVSAATSVDSGTYSVVVRNSQGSVTSSGSVVTVLPPSPPFFTAEPASVIGYSGQGLQLAGGVDGSPPFWFEWRKNGITIPGTQYTSQSKWAWHTLTNLSQEDAGSYTLVVTNALGAIESTNAVVTVIPSVAPVITRHPRSLEVAEGVNTWMSVLATGTPAPGYGWMRVGEATPPPSWPPHPSPGNPNPLRSFSNVTAADAGVYYATAANLVALATSREALLTVLPSMTMAGSWTQGAEAVFVTNGLAFLAQGATGLGIFSATDAAAPVLLGRYDTPGYASAVTVSGDLAFVADGSAGLQIIRISDPSAPILVGSYDTPGNARDVVVRNNLIFVADDTGGLLVLGFSDPTAPAFLGRYSTNIRATSVCVSGNLAFVASPVPDALPGTNLAGLLVIDIADSAHPVEVSRLGTGFYSVTASGGLVFGATGTSVEALSVTNPAQPVVVGSFRNYPSTNMPPRLGLGARDVCLANGLGYVAGNSGDEWHLYVLDLRDPTEPIPVGHMSAPGYVSTICVQTNQVFISGLGGRTWVIETPFSTQLETAPWLSLAVQNGMKLRIHGRRGLRYELESTEDLTSGSWQSLQSVLITNEIQSIDVSSPSSSRYFRLR